MPMTMDEIDAAVARGVESLDTHVPGWASVIDLSRFDIATYDWCVIGQISRFHPNPGLVNATFDADDQSQGFTAGLLAPDDVWLHLEAEWTRAILERRTGES
jgi:hypothetical protein